MAQPKNSIRKHPFEGPCLCTRRYQIAFKSLSLKEINQNHQKFEGFLSYPKRQRQWPQQ